MRRSPGLIISILLLSVPGVCQRLTLKEAYATALRNHPSISAAVFNAQAEDQVTAQTRSAYYPNLVGSITAAGAAEGTRLAAGALNNPIIYNRFATGFAVNQLITDFGRTSSLTQSARLRAEASEQELEATRASVLAQVSGAYFGALRARSVLTVARQTVDARQLMVDQITALADSKLKSGLDVSFAQVNLSEAQLFLTTAENQLAAAFAELSAAMGYSEPRRFELMEEPLPDPLPANVSTLIREAVRSRPELAALRAEHNAALQFVRAQKALAFPSITAMLGAGAVPGREDALRGRYGALGVNINVPVFNGHLFSARRAEAEYRARAAQQRLRDMENRIARDVQIAWLNARTAQERLFLTAQLLGQASKALDLAQTRYELGLSSIVELSQAQLSKTSAEISNAAARYEYQLQRTLLQYQIGALK